jgi:hypothetical protein
LLSIPATLGTQDYLKEPIAPQLCKIGIFAPGNSEYTVAGGHIYYYLYDRTSKNSQPMFTHRPKLEQFQLSKRQPVSFKAGDGLNELGFFFDKSLPPGPSSVCSKEESIARSESRTDYTPSIRREAYDGAGGDMNWIRVGLTVFAGGLMASLTDWLFMGDWLYKRYNQHPEIWRYPHGQGEMKAIAWSAPLPFVTCAFFTLLCARLNLHSYGATVKSKGALRERRMM